MSDFAIPKKSLGQHWLHDEASLASMADSVGIAAGDTVLEIGPGLGTLTQVLLDRGAFVTAVEFDHELAEALPRRVSHDNLRIIEQDILTFDFTSLPAGYKVAANIPYYLTSNLLRVMSESKNPFSEAALLVQKEVAVRVCAKPGTLSVLAVSVQFYCDVSLGALVPAILFTPPPKVDSQVLVLRYRSEPLFPDVDVTKFFRLVKAGFRERRKKLRSSLSSGLAIPKEQTEVLLASASIDHNLRAQNLTLDDWYRLYLAHYRTEQ